MGEPPWQQFTESGVYKIVRCVACGAPTEPLRWCFVHPTCYACLPPPPPLVIEYYAEESQEG